MRHSRTTAKLAEFFILQFFTLDSCDTSCPLPDTHFYFRSLPSRHKEPFDKWNQLLVRAMLWLWACISKNVSHVRKYFLGAIHENPYPTPLFPEHCRSFDCTSHLHGVAGANVSATIDVYSTDAVLTHGLNSANAKMGQTVTAKLTDDVKTAGAMELPKGTLLLGKVDQVRDSSSKGGCTLSLIFDRAQIGKGHEIPIKATLLGAYPPPVYSYDGVAPSMATQPSSISGDHTVDQGPGMLNGISLTSAVKSSVSGVFTSTNRSIKLQNGTRLQVAIGTMTPAAESN